MSILRFFNMHVKHVMLKYPDSHVVCAAMVIALLLWLLDANALIFKSVL